jgi:hypothetical protein
MDKTFCTHLRLFRRSRYRWGDNIKTDLKEMYWKDMDWIHVVELLQEFVDTNMKFRHRKMYKVSRLSEQLLTSQLYL